MAQEPDLRAKLIAAKEIRGVSELAPRMTPGNKNEILEVARRAAETKEPLALRDLGMFFAMRPDSRGRDVGYEVEQGITASAQQVRDAWFLAACEFGEICDRSHPIYAGRCMNEGWCDTPTLEENFLKYSYAPAEAEALLAARATIVRSLRTGVWPERFWSGRRAR